MASAEFDDNFEKKPTVQVGSIYGKAFNGSLS